MAGKRDKPEEIVVKLRQVEVPQGRGMSVAEAVRQIGVTQRTCCRWRRLHGGMGREQLKRLEELEKANLRPRRAVSDLTPDKLVPAKAAKGNYSAPRVARCPAGDASHRREGALHRERAADARRERAPRLPHAWPAPFHAAQGAPGAI